MSREEAGRKQARKKQTGWQAGGWEETNRRDERLVSPAGGSPLLAPEGVADGEEMDSHFFLVLKFGLL